MLVKVVDKNGKHLGWLESYIFIPVELEKFFIKSRSNRYRTVRGSYYKGILRVGNESFKSIASLLSLDFACNLCNILSKNYLHNFLVIPINQYEFCNYYVKYNDFSGYFYIIYYNGCEIGYLISRESFYESDTLYIQMIEFFNKGQGFGTSFIKYLLSLGFTINGMSMITARDFWLKQGAVFRDGLYFSLNGGNSFNNKY